VTPGASGWVTANRNGFVIDAAAGSGAVFDAHGSAAAVPVPVVVEVTGVPTVPRRAPNGPLGRYFRKA